MSEFEQMTLEEATFEELPLDTILEDTENELSNGLEDGEEVDE